MQFLPSSTFPTLATPLFMERVQAGFPSPAQGYEQKAIDLNTLMVANPPATVPPPTVTSVPQGPPHPEDYPVDCGRG